MAEEKESLARSQLPYRAEYCKTSRARCKKCNEPMEAGSLKIASSAKSRFHDGLDYSYHHVGCFFRIKRPASVAEISHYEALKFADQKMLDEAIETNGRSVLGGSSQQVSSDSKKTKRSINTGNTVVYDDFLVEYAKSGRSTCIKCEQKIEKDAVRIGKLDYNAEGSFKGGPIPRWYHIDCFSQVLRKVEFDGNVSKVPGFDVLENKDQKIIKKTIKPIKLGEDDAKKSKKDDIVESEEDRLLRKQSNKFFKLRELISSMKRKDIETMMGYMHQKCDYKNISVLTDMATDVLMFGPIGQCPQCKKIGHIILRTNRYICTSTAETGSTCTFESSDPPRGAPDIPKNVFISYDFFEDYEFKPRKRIFPSVFIKAVEEKEAENNNVVAGNGPLDGIVIGITSWQALNTEKTKVQKKVMTLGGKLITALDKSLFVILSSEDELSKNTPKIEVAKALDVPFATEEFLFKIQSRDDVVTHVSKSLINKWEGDLNDRFEKLRAQKDN